MISFKGILTGSRRHSLVIILSLLTAFVWGELRLDPTDDFSISLVRHTDDLGHRTNGRYTIEKYRKTEEIRLQQIFKDHLKGVSDRKKPLFAMLLARELSVVSRDFGFDPVFILALINVESSFRVDAKSPVGAYGLMQLMPGTAAFMAKKLGLQIKSTSIQRMVADPVMNLRLGVFYLAELRDYYLGSSQLFLAAYNAGPARLDGFLEQANFQPKQLKIYFHRIRRQMGYFRNYTTFKNFGVKEAKRNRKFKGAQHV